MISTILPLAFTAIGLGGALLLFVGLKRDLFRQSSKNQVTFAQMLDRLNEAERPAVAPPPASLPVSLRPGMNIQKRVHALRLLRRGEDVAHIAAALSVPRREVELLIRVAELTGKRASAKAAGE